MESNRASLRAMRARYPARRLPVVDFRQDEPEMPEGAEECPDCEGTGNVMGHAEEEMCTTCEGDGWTMPYDEGREIIDSNCKGW